MPWVRLPSASSPAAALADHVEQGLLLLAIDGVQRPLQRGRQFGRVFDALAVAAGGGAHLLERRQLVEVDEGGRLLRAASPLGYMPRVARRTAPHIALLTTTNSTGSRCIAEAWCTATGFEKMYEPSPRTAMTWRSGSANLTPSAAPAPQPSPAAGLDPKKLPGRVDGQCCGNSVYSLTMTDSGIARRGKAFADPHRAYRLLRRDRLAHLAPAGLLRLAARGDATAAGLDRRARDDLRRQRRAEPRQRHPRRPGDRDIGRRSRGSDSG